MSEIAAHLLSDTGTPGDESDPGLVGPTVTMVAGNVWILLGIWLVMVATPVWLESLSVVAVAWAFALPGAAMIATGKMWADRRETQRCARPPSVESANYGRTRERIEDFVVAVGVTPELLAWVDEAPRWPWSQMNDSVIWRKRMPRP